MSVTACIKAKRRHTYLAGSDVLVAWLMANRIVMLCYSPAHVLDYKETVSPCYRTHYFIRPCSILPTDVYVRLKRLAYIEHRKQRVHRQHVTHIVTRWLMCTEVGALLGSDSRLV